MDGRTAADEGGAATVVTLGEGDVGTGGDFGGLSSAPPHQWQESTVRSDITENGGQGG